MERARRPRADMVIALVLLAIAGGYAWLAVRLPERNLPGSVGLAFVPILLAGLLTLLAGILLAQALWAPGEPLGADGPGWGQAGTVVGLMAAYIFALARIGFLLATPPFLAIAMWQTGARRPGFILLMAVGLTAAVWAVFATLFAVPLPRGPVL